MDDEPIYAGRVQQGEELLLTLSCTTEDMVPEDPDFYPRVSVYRDAEPPALVETTRLAAADRGAAAGLFRLPLFLGPLYETPGQYLLVFRWQTQAGVGRSVPGSFQLLPGGDADGHVVAQAFVARPDGNTLIAQCDSGRIIRGRNPR